MYFTYVYLVCLGNANVPALLDILGLRGWLDLPFLWRMAFVGKIEVQVYWSFVVSSPGVATFDNLAEVWGCRALAEKFPHILHELDVCNLCTFLVA